MRRLRARIVRLWELGSSSFLAREKAILASDRFQRMWVNGSFYLMSVGLTYTLENIFGLDNGYMMILTGITSLAFLFLTLPDLAVILLKLSNTDLIIMRFLYRLKAIVANRRTVSLPPGTNLLNIAKFVYSKKTLERLFNQIVFDMREEHLEALAAGDIWHARWIHLRGNVAFLTTVVMHSGVSVAVKLFKAVKGAWS